MRNTAGRRVAVASPSMPPSHRPRDREQLMRHFPSRPVLQLPHGVLPTSAPTPLVSPPGFGLPRAPTLPSTGAPAVTGSLDGLAERAQQDRSPAGRSWQMTMCSVTTVLRQRREARHPWGLVRRTVRRPANFTVPRCDRGLGGSISGSSLCVLALPVYRGANVGATDFCSRPAWPNLIAG